MIYVSNPIEMTKALSSGETVIDITRSMAFANPIYLPNGIQLSAIPQENGVLPTIFFSHSDGLILTGSSRLQNLSVVTLQDKKAIQLTSQQVAESFGTIHLENLTVDGQISLIFRTPTLKAHVVTKNVHVASSDTRTYLEQPQKYEVNVLQGAYTLYNFNANKDSLITASIDNLSIGSEGHPAIGSGVFISGFNDQGGRVDIDQMTLGDVYSTGLIPQGVADFITGAVFVVYGAHISHLIQNGKTVTYGVNDMVLDAWGQVDEWVVNDDVISYGQSGVGFVNFGTVNHFKANKAISTYGTGARAYNQYDGTLKEGYFAGIQTFNNGAVGIQISKKVGKLVVDGDIVTQGGLGQSLVKGVNVDLPAYALSMKDGGQLESLTVTGNIISHGDKVTTVTMEDGALIHHLEVTGQIEANGQDSQAFDTDQTKALFKG